MTLAFAPVLVLELGWAVLELEGQQVAPEVEFAVHVELVVRTVRWGRWFEET